MRENNATARRPVVGERAPKSMSRETTFEPDLHPRHDRETLSRVLLKLCQRVSGDLVRQRYLGQTVGIKLRYADFRTLTREITLEAPTADVETIRSAASVCLKRRHEMEHMASEWRQSEWPEVVSQKPLGERHDAR